MGLRVRTNVTSINVQSSLFNVGQRLAGNYSRLSSGLRIANAADDASGLGISERMRAEIRSYSVASRNVQDGISLVQTAEGALSEVGDLLGRMRELSMQAATGTLNSDDRSTLDNEFQQIVDEVDRIAGATDFNGIQLLDGTNPLIPVLAGIGGDRDDYIVLTAPDATAGSLGIDGSISTLGSAASMLSSIDSAIDDVATARGTLGAQQNRLTSTLRTIATSRENAAAAESRIRDVDVAQETADLARNTILQQAALAVLSQANSQPQVALSLLG